MNRWELGLTLFVAACTAAVVGPNLTMERHHAWMPQEVQSPLFTQQVSHPAGRTAHAGTRVVLASWGRPASPLQVRPATFTPGRVTGVLVSLNAVEEASLTNPTTYTADAVMGCDFISVNANNPNFNGACSVNSPAGQPYCSVNYNPPAGGAGGSCSALAGKSCSAGSAGGPSNSTNCSTQNSSSGSCSTTGNNGGNCSTSSANQGDDPGPNGLYCSVSNGNGNTCSTGTAVGGTCSANGTPGGNAGQENGNTCSVTGALGSGLNNQCSATAGQAGTCSVTSSNAGGGNDFCSVDANTSGTCTVIGNGAAKGAVCSVQQTGQPPKPVNGGTCSIKGQQYNGGQCKFP